MRLEGKINLVIHGLIALGTTQWLLLFGGTGFALSSCLPSLFLPPTRSKDTQPVSARALG
jgi:hypothetical protein